MFHFYGRYIGNGGFPKLGVPSKKYSGYIGLYRGINSLGFPKISRFGGRKNQDNYSILGSILGSPYLWKLPCFIPGRR